MINHLLVTIILVFYMVAGNSNATTLNEEYKKPQIHGIFKLYINELNQFTITRSHLLNKDLHYKQTGNLHGNHMGDFVRLQTPKQKALYSYQFLLKVAEKADIRAYISPNHHNKDHFVIGIIEDSETRFEHLQALIPYKDMKIVFPLFLDLIKSQTPIHFELDNDNKNRDIIKSNRHQSTNLTPQQAWEIADNYNFGFNLLKPEDKALDVYLFLLQLAMDTNFKVDFSNKYQSNNALMLNIAAQGLDQGVEFELMPTKEIEMVYPLVLEFMQDRPSTYYKDPKIVAAEISKNNKTTN